MGNFVVAPAASMDVDGLAEVQTVGWRQGFAGLLPAAFLAARVVSAESWRERLASPPPYANFVARRTDPRGGPDVVGFITVGPATAPPPVGERVGQLYALYVRAEVWGTGVGWRLHQAGMESLRSAGFTEAVLWSLVGNARALRFYLRQGWTRTGTHQVEQSGDTDLPVELLHLDLVGKGQASQGRER